MTKSSKTTSYRKQSKHSSSYSDSETEIELVDYEEKRERRTKKTNKCKDESFVRVSFAGEDFDDADHISSKRRRESEKKIIKDKIADTGRPSKEEVRIRELKKELEKLTRGSRHGSVDKGGHYECVRDEKDSRRSTGSELFKDGASYSSKYGDNADRDSRRKDGASCKVTHGEAADRDSRHSKDVASYTSKCREDADRHKDGAMFKVRSGEAADRDSKHKDAARYKVKYEEDVDRDGRHKDGASFKVNSGEAAGRDSKHKDAARYKVKYEEDADRDSRHKDDASYKVKYEEDADRVSRHKDGASYEFKYGETADRDRRYKDAARYKAKYEEDVDRDSRHKDAASYKVKYGEDADRDSRSRENFDCKKRHREDWYNEEYALRDHHSDMSGGKHAKDENYAVESRYKKSRYGDGEQARYNDDKGSRGDGRVDYDYSASKSIKERHVDPEKNNGGDTMYNYERRNRTDEREDQTFSRFRSTREWHVDPEKNDGGYTRYKDDKGDRADDREDQNNSRSQSTKEWRVDPKSNAGEFTRDNDVRRSKAGDRKDRSYSRSQSTKEQHFDPEEKVSGMAEPVADKEGSRLPDADLNVSCKRQRNSPSSYSHLSKDQSRPSIQAELKYGEPEESVRQNLLPSKEGADVSGVLEKPCLSKHTKGLIDTNDSSFGDFSVEWDLTADESKRSTSTVDLIDGSKLTRSTGDNYDCKTNGFRSGVKETGSSCAEGKRSWQFPSKILPTGEKFQEYNDVFPSSSSINAGQVPSNSCSKFRRPHNHYKRVNRPNSGPVHGNARKGLPNWPSPLVNNFTHFQQGAVAVGFHPLVHQFPAFPMHSARPFININHPVFSHHVPDGGRYISHGQQCEWQNPVDNGSYPPLPGKDVNNVATRPEYPAYQMFDWNHNTESIGGQQLETSADMLKDSTGGVHPEPPSVSQEENSAVYAKEGETCLGVSRLLENQIDTHLDKGQKVEIGLDSDDLAKEPCKPAKSIAEKLPKLSKIPKDDDGHLWLVYLSRLDVSTELTHPVLYKKCLTLMDVKQNESIDEYSLELLCLEEVVKTQWTCLNLRQVLLFLSPSMILFFRAMSFYKKQREETTAIAHPLLVDGQPTSFYGAQKVDVVPVCDREIDMVPCSSFNELKQGQFFPACTAPKKKVDESVTVLSLEISSEPNPRQVNMSILVAEAVIKDKSPTLHNASQSAPSRPGYLSRVCDRRGSMMKN